MSSHGMAPTAPDGRVRFIGLTGGIATGKSTAARVFAEQGAYIIDADQVARRVVAPGSPALADIRTAFGEGVLDAYGGLHRRALAERVFRDASARSRLNDILHPRIEREALREAQLVWAEDPGRLVVYDVPLLFEAGLQERFDLTVVVYVQRHEQLRRLIRRDRLSREDARARLDAQMDIEEKTRLADVVLDNRGSREDLALQVRKLVERLRSQRS